MIEDGKTTFDIRWNIPGFPILVLCTCESMGFNGDASRNNSIGFVGFDFILMMMRDMLANKIKHGKYIVQNYT